MASDRGHRLPRPRPAAADRGGHRSVARTARAFITRAGTASAGICCGCSSGPGILAMLGENDGPSMIAYAADGAQYGLGFFVPFIPVLFAMAFVCQEMCMRVGAVTHRGYGELVLQRYGSGLGLVRRRRPHAHQPRHAGRRVRLDPRRAWPTSTSAPASPSRSGLALVAVHPQRRALLALGAHRARHGALQRPVPASPRSWSNRTSGRSPARSTSRPFPGGSFNTLLLLLASTIGATVTPWMIFFQQSASADKGMTPRDIKHGRYDTAVGAALAAIFGVGALIAGAALLHPQRSRASRGSPAPGFPRRSGTSPAAPPAPCSRSA